MVVVPDEGQPVRHVGHQLAAVLGQVAAIAAPALLLTALACWATDLAVHACVRPGRHIHVVAAATVAAALAVAALPHLRDTQQQELALQPYIGAALLALLQVGSGHVPICIRCRGPMGCCWFAARGTRVNALPTLTFWFAHDHSCACRTASGRPSAGQRCC